MEEEKTAEQVAFAAAAAAKELARSMGTKLGHLDRQHPQLPTIHRVIPSVRRGDSCAYEPKVISIGPFHCHNKKRGRPHGMEELKWQYLQDLLRRRGEVRVHDSIVAAIYARVKDIRAQYSEELGGIKDDTDLVRMMVLDGCFILELLLKRDEQGKDVVLPGGKWVFPIVRRDLLLLENQIPFFVLEILFKTMAPRFLPLTLPLLAYRFVNSDNVRRPPPPDISTRRYHHLLHLYHHSRVQQCPREEPRPSFSLWQGARHGLLRARKMVFHALFQVCFRLLYLVFSSLSCRSPESSYDSCNSSPSPLFIPSVTKLNEAGVRFRRPKEFRNGEAHCMLKIRFSYKEGVFEIPSFMLHGSSKSRFRNLIAFEQCCHHLPDDNIGLYYTSYCLLMAHLIDTESDVDILEEHGILSNFRGSGSEAAALFDEVCKGVAVDPAEHFYLDVMKDVSKYCESDLHRWRARLTHDYFSNPWAIISVAAAAVLLGLSIVQTFYSICAYYHPR